MAYPGERMRELRERRGFTLDELAARSGVSKGFLSEVENAKGNLSAAYLLRVANALGASVDYLLRGETHAAPDRQQVVIPPELATVAAELDLSYRDTVRLLDAHNSVVARRSEVAKRALSPEDWGQMP